MAGQDRPAPRGPVAQRTPPVRRREELGVVRDRPRYHRAVPVGVPRVPADLPGDGARKEHRAAVTARVGVISQARATSTRLPGKVLLPVGGRTFLEHHLDRVAFGNSFPVIVATTVNAEDDPIVAVAERAGLPWYRGSELDVLERFAGAADQNALDVVVRVTSDCPLIDGRVVAAGVERYLAEDDPRLYAANTLERTYPRGFDFEIFSADLLREAHKDATRPEDREHVTSYLHQ